MRLSRRLPAALAVGVFLAGLPAWPFPRALAAAEPAQGPQAASQRVDRAVRAAADFLLAQIDAEGKSAGEAPPDNPRFGGKTALCVEALLTAGLEPDEAPALARAIAWLGQARLHGTYAVALRACAWSLLRDPKSRPLLRQDTEWLLRAANDQGGYTYVSCDGKRSETSDNSNAQMALLGVWSGAQRGVEAPLAYWGKAERYWLDQQQADGGWGYQLNPRTLRAKSYGSMTAAGLASLYVCFDNLRAEDFVRCESAREPEAIQKALAWLGRSFHPHENPDKGVEWYYYWLFCVARVGLASGHKHFQSHDWYAEGRSALLARQNPDGSWGYGDRVTESAFALMFLVRGRHPVLLNKLRWPGKWNARPRDAANLARWVWQQFERPVAWQIVNLDSPLADWHEAPVLYISGAGPIELNDEQVARLRAYVQQGGMILSEAACNSGDFTLDMGKVYARLFPDHPLIRLPAAHPVYSAYFKPQGETWLSGVTNGVRLLAVHAPRELSLALQLGAKQTQAPIYELAANVCMYATDRGNLRPRDAEAWPAAQEVEPRVTIRLARLRHGGNCDPEPLAFQRLAILIGNRQRVRLDVSQPGDIALLDARQWPVAHMTGTDAFELSDAESAALRRYFADGGTLVADAAGGSRAFSDCVRRLIYPLAGPSTTGELAGDHPLYAQGPYELKKVQYRRDYALILDEHDRTRPRLHVVLRGERPAVIHSRDDITTGLLGIPVYKLAGYAPESAQQLMTNILFHAAGLKAR